MKIRKVTEKDYPDMVERLKAAQKASELSIVKICGRAEISTQYWYQIINGKVDALNFETLKKLEAALGVDFGVSFEEGE